MIGGYDIVLFHEVPEADALELLVSTAKTVWPDCVLVPDGTNDVFVYENQAAKDSWDTNGATDENDPKMVHLVVTADKATIVCSGDTESTRKYIGSVILAKGSDGGFPFWFY